MTSEAKELRQPFAGSATQHENTLSAKAKKERFEECEVVDHVSISSFRQSTLAVGPFSTSEWTPVSC
ncbi:hypothetical protein PHMEG_0003119 [Phytophthora megakarya]|uniref:Uncharacterized protein n=1 Tax=Phytophthora megakarya TaxID=4795 RepID=A0A225WX09_9STRA|nr:hypothetical protein PHMEG_0003119 [Phytophthora megakarya]